MTKPRPRIRLGVMLVGCTILSLCLAVLVFLGLESAADDIVNRRIFGKERVLEAEQAYFDEFLEYMNQTQSSISDSEAILSWVKQKRDLMLVIFDPKSSYTSASARGSGMVYASVSDANAMYELLQDKYDGYWYSCAVMAASDPYRSRTVKVMYFPMYRYQGYISYANAAISLIAFAAVLFAFISSKTRYIARLSRELRVMQGGELGVPMTIRGGDELTSLAEDIEQMRKSFIERLETEERMSRNSSDLLTAMSHDLRTPLTALIGYLDIVDMGKCADNAQILKYTHNAKLKAYQIKEMTDKLFEYFLVYSSREEELQTEELDASILFPQLWSESALLLEAEGFQIAVDAKEGEAPVLVNVPYLKRVFDNIVSNLRKYAFAGAPVSVDMGAMESAYTVRVKNAILSAPPRAESSGIGLASCKKMMRLLGGNFETEASDGCFVCILTLPLASATSAAALPPPSDTAASACEERSSDRA